MEKDKKESGPQIEEGHTDIANELLEAMAKTTFIGEEIKIFWALSRLTWGYAERDKKGHYITYKDNKGKRQIMKKKMAHITTKQWIKLTGLKKENISRTLKRLVKRNIVIREGKGYKGITWGINKYYKLWDKKKFVISDDNKDNKNIVISDDNKLLSDTITKNIVYDNKIITKPLKKKPFAGPEENSYKKTYIKKGEKEDIYFDKNLREEREEKKVFDHWNSLNIFEHKTFKFFKENIREAINRYGFEKVGNTIKNYSLILKDEKYFYDYEHTISSFLDPKNFEKFIDLEKAKKNFTIRRVNGETEAVEYERYKPEPGKKETEEERKVRYKKSAERIGDLKRELKEQKNDKEGD